jgi:outer membrane receptor for ferric coprogen and ferric-rhodotorulic acid
MFVHFPIQWSTHTRAMTNLSRLVLRFLSLGFAILTPLLSLAQPTLPPPSASPEPAKEEVVVMSPFLVASGEGESGYASDITTSGSRLKTSLKDVASSVSVLTKEFMDDLAATNIAGALAFVAGAETDATFHNESLAALGGPNGYVGGDFGDNNNRSDFIRVRGLGAASVTQNFIETLGSTDRYNTDRTEFLRGANSVLFGLAQPAGLVNSSTKVANLQRNRNSLEAKFDNFGSTRFVADFSRVLIPNRWAVRVVGLEEHERYKVDTAFEKDRRLYLTSSLKPLKNTLLTVSYENQRTRARRPNYRTIQDNVSEWLNAYNTYAPQMTPAQIDQVFFWNPTVQKGLAAPSSVVTLANGTTVDLGLIRRPLDTRPQGTALIYSGNGDWNTPLGNRATNLANRTVTGGNATPASAQVQFFRSGSARENSANFLVDPQVTDERIFPYGSVEIAALPGSYRREDDEKVFVNLEQRITDDLYLSASFQQETWDQEQYFAVLTQTNQISVDITKTLPDGRANPNFLRPFIYGRNIGEAQKNSADNYVFQANYNFDFAKKTERLGWLGLHRITGIFTRKEYETRVANWQYMWDNDVPVALTAANNNQVSPNRWIMQMWYVGDPVQVGDAALRFTGFPNTLNSQWDRSYDYTFWNNTVTPAGWQQASQQLHSGRQLVNNGGSHNRQINEGYGVSMQSYFWKKRLITLFGWRTDSVDSSVGNRLLPTLDIFPRVPGAEPSDFPTRTEFSNSASTSTQSAVFKVTESIRVFANRSENFAATAPRNDNLYRTLPPPTGRTTDYGAGFTALDGKLDVRYTHFESSQKNADSNNSVARLRIVAFEDNLYNALEVAGRLSEWSTVATDGVGTTTARYANPANPAGTEDRVSEGDSIEISFRPNRNWDFVAGVDRLDNVVTNVGTQVGEFLALRAPFYKKYFDQGLRVNGTTDPVSTSQLLRDQFISAIAQNYVNELVSSGTSNRGISEYSAKLVGRYKFLGGALKGTTIGANLRWESGKIIGYAHQNATFNFGGLDNYPGRVFDPSKPYESSSILAGGMMVSYQRRIWSNRINWRIQVNAQNLFSDTGLMVFGANPDGSPIWSRNRDRVYELSSSFDF